MKSSLALPLLLAFAMTSPWLQAKEPHKAEPSKSPEVVAHIPLNSTTTMQMFTRRGNKGRLYLYALGAAGQAVSVVDITDAARPSLVSQVAYPSSAGYGNVQPLGINTALVEIPDQPAAAAIATPVKNVALLDTSDPAAPHITLRFAGVTAVSRDDSRSLLFIANSDGLWIVRHYEPPDVSVAAWESFVAAQ